ncbi:MAG: hypothetical protein AVDCRST_MAG03-2202, partial [uncultured Rubrobacteraceae bacterium]
CRTAARARPGSSGTLPSTSPGTGRALCTGASAPSTVGAAMSWWWAPPRESKHQNPPGR